MNVNAAKRLLASVVTAFARPWAMCLLVLALFFGGALLRYEVIYQAVDPRAQIESDMRHYIGSAFNAIDPVYSETISDTIYPPGGSYFYGALASIDPSLKLATFALFVLSVLTFVLLAATASVVFGRKTALLTLIAAASYLPFAVQSAFFLTEGPLNFCLAAFLLVMAFACLASNKAVSTLLFALGGICMGAAFALKSVILIMVAVFVIFFLIAGRFRSAAWLKTAAFVVGFSTFLIPLAKRCTDLGQGQLCLNANEFGRALIIGHDKDQTLVRFRADGFHAEFGSPVLGLRREPYVLDVPYAVHDTKNLIAFAMDGIRRDPLTALRLSFANVADLFVLPPWPYKFFREQEAFRWIYLALFLMPALYGLARLASRRGSGKEASSNLFWSLFFFIPLTALMAGVFLSAGEPRYRIAVDGPILILATAAFAGESGRTQLPRLPWKLIAGAAALMLVLLGFFVPRYAIGLDATPRWHVDYFVGDQFQSLIASNERSDIDTPFFHPSLVPARLDSFFSLRAESCLTLEKRAAFIAELGSDDGSRLWIDDRLVIDNWRNQLFHKEFGGIELEPGRHRVRVEYYQYDRGAALAFSLHPRQFGLAWTDGVGQLSLCQ